MNYKYYYKSPIGIVEVALDESGHPLDITFVNKLPKNANLLKSYKLKHFFDQFFKGDKKAKFKVDYTKIKMTPFQIQVLKELQNIPAGNVLTYKELAKKIGRPMAARAVGGACAKNPLPIIIPCHRVIGSNGRLTGFSMLGGIKSKAQLLDMEKQSS